RWSQYALEAYELRARAAVPQFMTVPGLAPMDDEHDERLTKSLAPTTIQNMKKSQNGSRLEETSALLQQAMATLLQNQALFVTRVEKLNDKMDQKFDRVDQRFAAIDKRLEHVESLLAKMFAELPEKV